MTKIILKFLLATTLCYWLFKSGKLDFSLLLQAIRTGPLWIIGTLILFTRLFTSAMRFKVLIDSKENGAFSFWRIFYFDAIGNLFTVILPGVLGGDMVRFFYFNRINSKITSGTLAALLTLDRLTGLLGLMALTSMICLFQLTTLLKLDSKLLSLIIINNLITLSLIIIFVLLFSNWIPKKKIFNFITIKLSKWPKLKDPIIDMLSVELSLYPFLKCFLFSLLNGFITLIGFLILIYPFIPKHTSLFNIFSIMPIGFIGASLPITPAGLGVGHVFFDNLFKLIQIENGASLYNLYFAANAFMCLMGIFPYLYSRKTNK